MTIENLFCNTTYHVRATTTNSVGGGVSGDSTFTTGACPTTWYVSPVGTNTNNGSISYPWSVSWAARGASTTGAVIQPGDTVYMRGGTYTFATTTGEYQYNFTISGTSANPITVQSYTGEWAKFDGNLNGVSTKNYTMFLVDGDYLKFRDFEITNSEIVNRKITVEGSNPAERRGNSFDDRGTGNKLINLIIHDTGQGIGGWANGGNNEYYGNVVYNNGWDAPDRLHGHGVYTQNDTGWKRYTNNIWLNPFGNNVSMYGSSASNLNNFTWEGNHFINGTVLFGGNAPIVTSRFYKNYFDIEGSALGYGSNENTDIVFRNNYFASSSPQFTLSKNVTFKYNTVIKASTAASSNYMASVTYSQAAPAAITDYLFDYNNYYRANVANPNPQFYSPTASVTGSTCNFFWFNSSSQGYGYCGAQPDSWQEDFGYDLHSIFITSVPTVDAIFYRKNKYDANRMNVYAYNWDGNTTISVDPSLVLDNGDSYEIHNTQDYFDDVITGTYNGSNISIDMSAGTRTLEKPVGYDEVVVGGGWYHDPLQVTTFPTFGTFVLVNTSGTTDIADPIISNILEEDVATSSINIWWDTNEDSTTVLNYGPTTSYGTASTTDDGTIYGTFYTTTHEINLTGLTPGTTYHYRLTDVDYAGNSVSSSDQTFTTDPVVQIITTGSASSLTSTSAILNGTIDVTGGANATEHGFAYSTDSGLTTVIATSTLGAFSGTGDVTSSISSLTCNTTYYFRIYSTNSVGTSLGSIQSLTTSACPLPSSSSSSSSSSSGGRRHVIPTTQDSSIIPQFIQSLPIFQTNESSQTIASIPAETPSLSLSSGWELFSSDALRDFVLSPLPKQLVELAKKFPKLGETFDKLGITTISDLDKLHNISFSLPKVEDEFPVSVVLAKGAGGKIDLGSSIVIDEKGSLEQKVKLLSNTKVTLMIKPDAKASKINGYLIFKESTLNAVTSIPSSSEAALSILPFLVAHAAEIEPPKPEMLVQSFEYVDPDQDGIYSAEIQTPAVEGIYEVVTLISYKDKDLGAKELRLTTVIDPEGYAYELLEGKEARVGGAEISLYSMEGNTLWTATDYNQKNPQKTDKSGKYAFLVPKGQYYITVEAGGYKHYKSVPFDVREGEPIHFNIEMEAERSFSKIFDWKFITILTLLIIGFFKLRRR